MTHDEQQKYHHSANEGETRAPAGETIDPHHALNTPVAAIDDAAEDVLGAEQDEAERLEDDDDSAEVRPD